MAETPNATPVVVKINGISYSEGDEFTVDRVNKKVVWTYTAANGGFDLVTGMKLEVVYKTTASVPAPTHI